MASGLITVMVAGCGGAGAAAGPTVGTTLRTAFSYNQGTLDPDIFYGDQGLQVTTSCYQGLVRYADNSTTIQPLLAQSYQVSADGTTYTFHLRPNVKFVDGSPLTSQVLKFDIARRKAVNGGPSYMVANVTSVDTPNPLTLIVHLNQPVAPFLNYLASPYGLKAVSEVAIKAHATSKDPWAQSWLADHCAGTGPYYLSNVVVNQSYTMKTYPGYWGPQPYFKTVQITQIPSYATQQLELRAGQLDVVTEGVSPKQVAAFQSNPNFSVTILPSIVGANFWINPHKPPFTNVNARLAVAMALDRPKLLAETFGDTATLTNSITSPGVLPTQYGGVYSTPYDPARAKQIVASLPASDRSVTVTYDTSNIINAQVAGIMTQQLNAVGFQANSEGVVESEIFNWHTDPESKRPQMLLNIGNPDDADPTSDPTVWWLSSPKIGIAFFSPYSPAADAVLAEGERQPSEAKAFALYGKAMDMYKALNVYVPIASVDTVAVVRKGITGVAAQRQGPFLLDIAALRGS